MKRLYLIILVLISLFSAWSLPTFAQEETDPYQIALDLIAEAELAEEAYFHLNRLGLTELPPKIGNLTNVQWLYLNANQLSSLHPKLGI